MDLDEKDVISCLAKAKEMIELYKLYTRVSNGSMRSVDEFEDLFCTYLDRKVVVNDLTLAADDSAIRGMFAALADGTYEIYLLAELPDRERRFVKCKELFHVVLDEDRSRSMDIYAHVEEAATSYFKGDSSPTSPVVCEALAEIAAMEFLFPYEDRVAVIAASDGSPNFERVAAQYGIPQSLVEEYLSSHYMSEFGSITW